MNMRLMKIVASLKLKMNRWHLNPPISLEKVQALETQYGFRLPKEYRDFITEIADGCCNYPSTNSKGKGGIMFSLEELDSVQRMDKAFQFQEIMTRLSVPCFSSTIVSKLFGKQF